MNIVPLHPFTVGGSEAASACGVNPYQSRMNLWSLKRGLIPAPPQTEAALWGVLLEPLIMTVLGNAHGFEVEYGDVPEFRDPERPWMIGHPDGFGRRDGQVYVIDAKTTGGWNAGQWSDDDAPTAYALQLQHYMHLTGCDRGLLACLLGGQRLLLRTIERDQQVIELMLRLEEEFVGLCESGTMPAPAGTSSDAEAIRQQFPVGEPGKTVELDAAAMALVQRYPLIDRTYERVKRQRDEIKQRLQLAMQDAEIAVSAGGVTVAKWTTFLRAGEPVRRFTITGGKT